MTTPTPEDASSSTVADLEASRFARQWLYGSRHIAIRSAPVIAIIKELITVLRDEQTPASQALLVLRRAILLLGALTAGTCVDVRQEDDSLLARCVPNLEDVTASLQCTRFAVLWLHGSPDEAIRTEPVIAILDELLFDIVNVNVRHSEIYARLRRALKVLSVLAHEDGPASPSTGQAA